MTSSMALLDQLACSHTLSLQEYAQLVQEDDPEFLDALQRRAEAVRNKMYGNQVFIRGLVEVGNACRRNCLYCGIRRENRAVERYVLSLGDVMACCREGYDLGFRTFVLQGGEGMFSSRQVVEMVQSIRRHYPDCAITLSLGEYDREDFCRMREAGADRYLLRHETANEALYRRLHPAAMSFRHRMDNLRWLRELGFQVGCGFMVGAPFQQPEHLAEDLKFVEIFRPHMCGVGPFLPQKDTPLGTHPPGSAAMTCRMYALMRLMIPGLLIPATTALGSLVPGGRETGIRWGANVVMPNLSPLHQRKKYALYDHKLATGTESAQNLQDLRASMAAIGYEVTVARGDSLVEG